MKPQINDKKCGANEKSCKLTKLCPVGAISHKVVKEPILDRVVNCGSSSTSSCGCGCNSDKKTENTNTNTGCGGASPYDRIVIDQDKCIECGVCVDACCGKAVEMADR